MGSPARPEFKNTSRFEIRRRLGAGAYGVVYEAADRERGSLVALKTLGRNDPVALYRFKHEFRSLTGLAHPHLVALYELLAEDDEWFFTMELVRGVDFLRHVWRSEVGAQPWDTADAVGLAHASTDSGDFAPTPVPYPASADASDIAPEPTAMWADLDRLRVALRQLGEGLSALHDAGKLHRDIKPSNVLVDTDGQVKILDFGLVQEMESLVRPLGIAGTPAYMSPEQAAEESMSAASDWYSVGVLLFQALTGQLPFAGEPGAILAIKQIREPDPPSRWASGIPPALEQLCQGLLRRHPRDRPSWPEVARVLGPSSPPLDGAAYLPPAASDNRPRRTELFIRRESLMIELRSAFDRLAEGQTVLVSLFGPSGMGKTSLVRQFLSELHGEERVVVLEGCCYSQETVPYKALDGIVDGLSHYLRGLPPSEVAALLPDDASALARLFPVMQQVRRVADPHPQTLEVPDDQELRARGARALREILGRLASRHRLVLFVDDFQWGDVDSAILIGELVAPPAPPNILWIAAYRSDDSQTSPILRRVLAWKRRMPVASLLIDLPVGELTPEQSHQLASMLVGDGDDAGGRAEAIAAEAHGSPFFIAELAHGLRASRAAAVPALADVPGGGAATLDHVIQSRVARLPEEERRLLEVVSTAGQPIERRIAAAAARLEEDEPAVLARLRAARLLRDSATAGADCIEAYHDRIRESVVARLDAHDLRGYHAALAAAMEAQPTPDPERLTVHFQSAGDSDKAARYALDAAARASGALAFDRAARLYRIALDHPRFDESEARDIRLKLAEALANAGRSRDAASAYLDLAATEGAGTAGAVELRRRAAEQLLRGGYLEEGIDAIRAVLASIGWNLPRNRRAALIRLLLRRLQLRIRGRRFQRRSESEISSRDLVRIDACWSVATGLGFVDPTLGGLLQARHLLWALQAGEPYRIARALALEAAYSSIGGGRTREQTRDLVAASLALAREQQNPHALALASETAGIAAAFEGRWKAAHDLLADAEKMLRERCAGVVYELDNAVYWRLFALAHRGGWRELQGRVPGVLKDANERGDLYLGTNLKLRVAFIAALAAGDSERAARELDEAMAQWAFTGFSNQHWWELLGRIQIALYRGRATEAWDSLATRWPAVERSFVLRIQLVKILAHDLRARAALAAHEAQHPWRDALLKTAAGSARVIANERMPWATPLAQRLEAGIASIGGDVPRAAKLLRESAAGFRAADMDLHAVVADRCLGQLMGGPEGHTLLETADAWMVDQRVAEPHRIAQMIAPGRWG